MWAIACFLPGLSWSMSAIYNHNIYVLHCMKLPHMMKDLLSSQRRSLSSIRPDIVQEFFTFPLGCQSMLVRIKHEKHMVRGKKHMVNVNAALCKTKVKGKCILTISESGDVYRCSYFTINNNLTLNEKLFLNSIKISELSSLQTSWEIQRNRASKEQNLFLRNCESEGKQPFWLHCYQIAYKFYTLAQ